MTRFASASYQGRALRPAEPRASARDLAARAGRTLFLALTMTALALIAPAVEEAVVTAPIFAVRLVDVRGAHTLGDDAVRRFAGLSPGMPMLAVDVDGAERALRALPRVASAEVDRRVWGRVVVQINERVSCALVLPTGRTPEDEAQHPLEIDREGVLMDPVDPMRWPDVPLVTGLVGAGAHAGQRVPRAHYQQLSALLLLLQRTDIDLADRVSSIDVARDSDWTITMAGSGISVRLPQHATTARDLLALRTALQDVEHRGTGELDMRFSGQVIWKPTLSAPADSTAAPSTDVARNAFSGPRTTTPPVEADVASHRTQTPHDDAKTRNTRGGRNATW